MNNIELKQDNVPTKPGAYVFCQFHGGQPEILHIERVPAGIGKGINGVEMPYESYLMIMNGSMGGLVLAEGFKKELFSDKLEFIFNYPAE